MSGAIRDPDEARGSQARGVLPSWSTIGLVFAGAVVGVAVRGLLLLATPDAAGTVLVINLVGAFLLGLVSELLPSTSGASGRWRMLIGTGALGGFTTYSTLAVQVVTLSPVLGAALAAISLIGGIACAWLGVVAGVGLRTRNAR